MEIKIIRVSNYYTSQCSWGKKKVSQHMQQKGGRLSFTVQDMSSGNDACVTLLRVTDPAMVLHHVSLHCDDMCICMCVL